MASGVADYGSTFLLGVLLGITPVPEGYWVALLAGTPRYDMDGTDVADLEPSSPDYGRVWVPAGPGSWELSGQFGVNVDQLDFGVSDGGWGVLDHYALLDDENTGNLYAFGEFATPGQPDADVPVLLPVGGLILQLVQVAS
jgi:hypothetical protein